MGHDEIDSYRRMMAAATTENPRKEADIQASLRAFEDAFKSPQPRVWPHWLRLSVLIPMGGVVAAGLFAIAFLPQNASQPDAIAPAPPALRLALPETPSETLPVEVPPAASGADALVLAAFSADLPQYFALPWDRGALLGLLDGAVAQGTEQLLFAADGRRLVVMERGPDLMGTRGQDETYQRFAVALAGLALLAKGQDLGPAWKQPELLAEARSAVNGMAVRDAALAAVVRE